MTLEEIKTLISQDQQIACALSTIAHRGISVRDYDIYVANQLHRKNDVLVRKVKSSNIDTVVYRGGDNKMTVQFLNGSVYTYDNVKRETFDEMVGAESVGKFFINNIRGNYQFKKEHGPKPKE